MSETNEKNLILENLNYIGLDLENIPDFLMEYKDVDYKPTRAYEQTDFKVYRYINLKDIQILLTPTNRLNSITEKYSKAMPICEYLNDEDENVDQGNTGVTIIERDIKRCEEMSESLRGATIINGEIYVVDTMSQGMFLRKLVDNGDSLTFIAENQQDFPDFELPYSDVINIFRVVGVLIPNL